MNKFKEVFLIESKLYRNYIWLYFISFLLLWSVRELWLVQYLEFLNPISGTIVATIIKIIIWIIPVFLMIKLVENKRPIRYLKLVGNIHKGLKWAAWTTLVFTIYFIILHMLSINNELNFNLSFTEWLNTIILVGIIEEIVFRGFVLRKVMSSYNFWFANVITSVLFVSIHFPIWIYHGSIEFPTVISMIIQVFVLSMLFGFIYKRTNSLWSVIMIHSIYDLLVSIFY